MKLPPFVMLFSYNEMMFKSILFNVLFLSSVCFAQPFPPVRPPLPPLPPAPPLEDEELEEPKPLPTIREHGVVPVRDFARPTQFILFLIDSSGSMDGDRIGAAIEFVLNKKTGVAAAPFDDFQIALATFGSGVARWEGTNDIHPETKKPMSLYGWSAMPSGDNLNAARAWITRNLDGQGTNMALGLRHCFESSNGKPSDNPILMGGLKKSVEVESLTILVITDGEVDHATSINPLLKRLQEDRVKSKLPEAIIGFVGIDVKLPDPDRENETGHTWMQKWAKKHGHLGYLRLEFIRKEEEEEEEN